MTDGPDVVFIGGASRSGSTLLSRMLGSTSNHVPIGELTSIWEQHFRLNRACGCGNDFRHCEFWNAVVDEAFGGIDKVDADEVVALRESVLHARKLPLLVIPELRPADYQSHLREYVDMLGALYRAIQKVSGCNVIIDSSKRPAHAWALTEVQHIRPTMILLVRDSRACAYSWQRRKRRIDVHDQIEYMKQHKGWSTTRYWIFHYMLTPLSSQRFSSVATVRYEDVVEAPAAALSSMVNQLGLPGRADFPFVSDRGIDLSTDHSLWGNPMRAERGIVTIQHDNEWLTKMAAGERRVVTLMTLPWLVKYRYRIAPKAPDSVLVSENSNFPG